MVCFSEKLFVQNVLKIFRLHLGVGGSNGSLDLLDNVVVLGELLALLISLAKTDADLLGDVEAEGVHHVSEEEEIDFAFAIPIVDVADVFDL